MMKDTKFICHPDFANEMPIMIYHKQKAGKTRKEEDEKFLNRHVLFRREFECGAVSKAILNITADDYYKLYINGCFVAMGPAASYPHAYNYNEIDVTPYLKEGKNLIAVHTFYQGFVNRVWVSGDHRQCLWCELFADGEKLLCSDESWKYHDHTGFTACGKIGYDTAFAECYDSNSAEVGFEMPDFDDSGWENAAIYSTADYRLRRLDMKPLDIYRVDAKATEQRGDTLFLDFGQEAVGYICATAKGACGDVIIIRCGEELNEDGTVRYAMRCNCRYEEKWILSGGEDVLNQFDYKCFRYAELVIPEGTELLDVYMLVRHYPYEMKAVYKTENEDLRRILKLCSDTTKFGTQENFVDCPTREKGQYLNDFTISARAQAVLTGDTEMMKKCLRDYCDTSFICPGLMTVSCAGLMQEIADASLQFPADVAWVYAMDGDIEFLRSVEPYVTGVYNYFRRFMRDDGLIERVTEKWNLVDWPKNLRDDYEFLEPEEELHNVVNAHWIGCLEALDEIYTILSMPKTGLVEKAKASFIKQFYSEEKGLFCDNANLTHAAIHSNVLPLLFEIGTEDEGLRERIINLICEKRLTSAGVSMAYFALAGLKKAGRSDLVEELILDEGCWLNMLREGATTTFEAWGKDQKWNTSLFHPWATAPAIVLAEGIRVY